MRWEVAIFVKRVGEDRNTDGCALAYFLRSGSARLRGVVSVIISCRGQRGNWGGRRPLEHGPPNR